MLSCNLPPALLAKWPGFFTCYCGNTGVKWIPKWVDQHRKLTLERKIPQPLPLGLEPATIRSRVRRSTTELSPLPNLRIYSEKYRLPPSVWQMNEQWFGLSQRKGHVVCDLSQLQQAVYHPYGCLYFCRLGFNVFNMSTVTLKFSCLMFSAQSAQVTDHSFSVR